jgi:type IV secretion system protein VirB8
MPLKTVVPYTLMVDRTTGYVQAIKPLNPSTVAPGTALTQSFLVQYVIGREGFDRDTVKTNYRKVALLSAGRARSSYLQQMQVSNPRSPLVLYPRGTSVDVRVKSVSPIGPNVALVRFDTVRTDAGGRAGAPGQWIAVVHYRYSGEPMSLEDRFVNPLGFEVTSYRRDSEAVSPAPEVEAAVQPAEAVVESASRPSPLIDSSPTAPEARQ